MRALFKPGFTLIEIVVVIVLTGILASFTAKSLSIALDTYKFNQALQIWSMQNQNAQYILEQDLRNAIPTSVISYDNNEKLIMVPISKTIIKAEENQLNNNDIVLIQPNIWGTSDIPEITSTDPLPQTCDILSGVYQGHLLNIDLAFELNNICGLLLNNTYVINYNSSGSNPEIDNLSDSNYLRTIGNTNGVNNYADIIIYQCIEQSTNPLLYNLYRSTNSISATPSDNDLLLKDLNICNLEAVNTLPDYVIPPRKTIISQWQLSDTKTFGNQLEPSIAYTSIRLLL